MHVSEREVLPFTMMMMMLMMMMMMMMMIELSNPTTTDPFGRATVRS